MSMDPWDGIVYYLDYIATDITDQGYTPTTATKYTTTGVWEAAADMGILDRWLELEDGEATYFTVVNTDKDPRVLYFVDELGLTLSSGAYSTSMTEDELTELSTTAGVLEDYTYGEDTTIDLFGEATSEDLLEAYMYTMTFLGIEITCPESLWQSLDTTCKNNTTDYGELWAQNPTSTSPECIFIGYEWEYTSYGFPFEFTYMEEYDPEGTWA